MRSLLKLLSVGAVVGLAGISATSLRAAADPAKVVGPEACGNCHKAEFSAWQQTHHFKTFEDLHRRPTASAIADKMGVKRIKSDGTCVACHYTQKGSADSQPIAGVSCESCHSAGQDWIKVHNEKGSLAKAEALGFISPDNIYALASNCFQCHTMPNEKLVNVGGHAAGSPLELVSWSQGEVRHHFLKDQKKNPEATQERKRMLYVVGRVVDLEYSLRALAKATEKANFAVSMAKRVAAAKGEMKKIAAVVPKPEIQAIVTAADGVALKLNNEANVMAAVDKISAAGKTISSTYKGEDLAAVDPLIPPASQSKGAAFNP
jgi:hypothetical protein